MEWARGLMRLKTTHQVHVIKSLFSSVCCLLFVVVRPPDLYDDFGAPTVSLVLCCLHFIIGVEALCFTLTFLFRPM